MLLTSAPNLAFGIAGILRVKGIAGPTFFSGLPNLISNPNFLDAGMSIAPVNIGTYKSGYDYLRILNNGP